MTGLSQSADLTGTGGHNLGTIWAQMGTNGGGTGR